ncbi:MAG: sugar ABC transporter permease [Lachnospiraceae bacterium]|nr:sugar ABC transporter permease [Lachnospiraceae bacterium]
MKKGSKLRKKAAPYLFLSPTLILMIVLLVIPICLVLKYSFQDNAIVVKAPEFVGFENYEKILGDEDFWNAAKNTVFFVVVSVVAHLVLGMCFALLLNTDYFGTRTKTIARVIYVLPWVFTASVIAILWKLMLQPHGIVDYLLSFVNLATKDTEWLSSRQTALATITFVNIWCGYPFYMISILAGLQGISADLFESAALDGANTWKTFWNITIPQLKPILISIAMLDFIWTIQSFSVIWMLTGGGPVKSTETLSIYIYKLAFNRTQYAHASTAAVIVLAVCIIIAVFYVKQQRKVRE